MGKERKRLKKLAKMGALNASVTPASSEGDSAPSSDVDMISLSKKDKKRLKDQKRRNKKAEENGINNTASDVSVKKSKKRKAEDWNDLIEEEEAFLAKENATPQQQPVNAWMKIVQTKSEKKS